jgi:hypothetical protein
VLWPRDQPPSFLAATHSQSLPDTAGRTSISPPLWNNATVPLDVGA